MDLYTALVLAHVVGTVLGVGGATFAEVNLIRALKDGEITPEEGYLMRGVYAILRLGFFLLIVSGFGFLLYYRLHGMEEFLYSEKLWAKLTVIGVLSVNAILLQTHKIPLLWGSAISFVSWYMALALGVMRGVDYSYGMILIVYGILIILAYGGMKKIHAHFVPNKEVTV
jgi:hypothetical protein